MKGYVCYAQTTQRGGGQGKRRIVSPYTTRRRMSAIFTGCRCTEGSLLAGRWGCGAAFLQGESKPAGVKWSLVKCVNGTPDPGGLIAGDETAGTGQSLPGPRRCCQGAEYDPEGREVSDPFAKKPSEIHPRPPFSSSHGCCLAAFLQLSFSWALIPVLATSLHTLVGFPVRKK